MGLVGCEFYPPPSQTHPWPKAGVPSRRRTGLFQLHRCPVPSTPATKADLQCSLKLFRWREGINCFWRRDHRRTAVQIRRMRLRGSLVVTLAIGIGRLS